ncbi:hypothetical protein D3C75_577240 [compost metagenome]
MSATGADGVQRVSGAPRIAVAAQVHQVGGYQLLLATGVGHRGHRVFDVLGVSGVEAAIHLGHEYRRNTHRVGGPGRALVVAAAGDGR